MYKTRAFIIFEGIEGTGKSIHSLSLIKKLKSLKIPCVYLREPGGSKNAEYIRSFLLRNENKGFNSLTDTLLYLAARNENYENIIKKNYRKKVILIDRFTDSTIAYQHYAMSINKKIIITLNKFILKNIKPNFTFLNIVSMKNLKIRLKKRLKKNRYDVFNLNFYNKAQKGFINLSNKKNYMIINSDKEIFENKKMIIKKINLLLNI